MNFGELTELVTFFVHRSDLEPLYPAVFELVNERISKDARLIAMEEIIDLEVPDEGRVKLPADYLEASLVMCNQKPLRYSTPRQLPELGGYSIIGGFLYIPGSAGGDCQLAYYARPAAMTEPDDENKVLSAWPSVYLQCALMYLHDGVQDLESQQVAAANYATEIEEANDSDRAGRSSGGGLTISRG